MSDIQEEQKRLYKRAEENDIRHFILETKDYGNFDIVEYEKYKELQDRINKATEYIEHYLKDIDNLDNIMINSIILKELKIILQGKE